MPDAARRTLAPNAVRLRRPVKIRLLDHQHLPFPTCQRHPEEIRQTCRMGWEIMHEFAEPLPGGYNAVIRVETRTTPPETPMYALAALKDL